MPFSCWEWAVPPLLVLPALGRSEVWHHKPHARSLLWAIAPSLLWLGLFLGTGDRRLYFCYTMQYAVQLACMFRVRGAGAAIAGGSAVIAAFTAVRIWQEATLSVLIVECLVAAAVLGLGLYGYGAQTGSPARRGVVGLAASLLAFAGLAF